MKHDFGLLKSVIMGIIFMIGMFNTDDSNAIDIAKTESEGIVIKITNEPCAFMDQIKNLPYRARWIEKRGELDGCYDIVGLQNIPIVTLWFSDLTVFSMPFFLFTPLRNL